MGNEYLSSDMNEISQTFPSKKLGFILKQNRHSVTKEHADVCSELCQRLLLTTEVEEIIFVFSEAPFDHEIDHINGVRYRFIESNNCGGPFNLGTETAQGFKFKKKEKGELTLNQLINLTSEQGKCFEITTGVPLNSADTIIIDGVMKALPYPRNLGLLETGLGIGRTTLLKQIDGDYRKVYQLTDVTATLLPPVLFPWIESRGQMQITPGILRIPYSFRKPYKKYSISTRLSELLQGELGWSLDVSALREKFSVEHLIRKALNEGNLTEPNNIQLVESLFSEMSSNDPDIYIDVLKNIGPNFPENTQGFNWKFKETHPETLPEFTQVIMENVLLNRNKKTPSTIALAKINLEHLQPYEDQILSLFKDSRTYETYSVLIPRLASLGDRGVDTLMRIAHESVDNNQRNRRFIDHYYEFMSSFCRLESRGSMYKDQIEEIWRLKRETGQRYRSDHVYITMKVAARAGISSETVWNDLQEHFQGNGIGTPKERFLESFKTAKSRKC